MIVHTNRTIIERTKYKSNIRCIIAIILAALFFIAVVSNSIDMIREIKDPDIDDPVGSLVAGVVVTTSCVVWYFAENKKKKIACLVDKYATIFSLKDDGLISRLAKGTGETEGKVIENLNYMLRKGYIFDANIDSSKGEFVSRVYA